MVDKNSKILVIGNKTALNYIRFSDIFLIYVHTNTVTIYTSQHKNTYRCTLKYIEKLLDESFQRIAKNYIVNMQHIKKIQLNVDGCLYVTMDSHVGRYSVSKRYRDTVITKLNKKIKGRS